DHGRAAFHGTNAVGQAEPHLGCGCTVRPSTDILKASVPQSGTPGCADDDSSTSVVRRLAAPKGVSLKNDHVCKIVGTQRDSATNNDAASDNAARLAFTAITGRGRQVGATTVDLVQAALASPPGHEVQNVH